jgi:hypothetical protein
MVQIMIWQDDLTGDHGAETRRLTINGCSMEIDLIDDNYAEFLASIAPYIRASRITSKQSQIPNEIRAIKAGVVIEQLEDLPPAAPELESMKAHTPEERVLINKWIKANGVRNASNQGRKPEDVWQAFKNNDLSLLEPDHKPLLPEPPLAIEAQAAS